MHKRAWVHARMNVSACMRLCWRALACVLCVRADQCVRARAQQASCSHRFHTLAIHPQPCTSAIHPQLCTSAIHACLRTHTSTFTRAHLSHAREAET
eukprot:6109467-Pleurochrysis_carterae.AAC.1